MKPRLYAHSVAAFATVLAISGCGDSESELPGPRPVRTMVVADSPALAARSFPGTAEAIDAVELSFRVGGPLVAFPAGELGKQVAKGELIAQIDPRDFEVRLRDSEAALAKAKSELDALRKARPEEIEQLKAELQQAEASAEFAKAEYDRYVKLQAISKASVTDSELQRAASKAKLDSAAVVRAKEALRIGEEGARPEDILAKRSQIDSLAAAVDTARDQLEDTHLLAPFDGTISATFVDNFEVVQAQQRIVRLVDASELEMRVDIPENLIALVPQVDQVLVTLQAYPDTQIPARIAEIGSEASSSTRTYPVKLRFVPPKNLGVRPGMSGKATGRVSSSARNAAGGHVVPSSAVVEQKGELKVWIHDGATRTVASRVVKVLRTTPYGLEVSGLAPGEVVVTAGAHFLDEGQEVRPLPTADGGQTS